MLERSFRLCNPCGQMGFIVPVSSVSTDRYGLLQDEITKRVVHFSSFDDRPSRLFEGLEHIRLTILLLASKVDAPFLNSTCYNKWNKDERNHLFHRLNYTNTSRGSNLKSIPKLGSALEIGLLDKLLNERKRLAHYYVKGGRHEIYYTRKVGYFLQILNFIPRITDSKGNVRLPSELKVLRFGDNTHSKLALGCLNSSLFYWFFTTLSDCRNVNKREVDTFPIDLDLLSQSAEAETLTFAVNELMDSINEHSEYRRMKLSHDVLTVQCVIPKYSKRIIDIIDESLAGYYGLSEEDLDYVANYDIKYRIGR